MAKLQAFVSSALYRWPWFTSPSDCFNPTKWSAIYNV